MELWQAYLILCPAAALGGAINAVAGGGTLVTFPALTAVLQTINGGTPDALIVSNATNTVSLCPGSFSSAWGYRQELKQLRAWIRLLALPSLLGGTLGSIIVSRAPEASFKALVPWLIALATVLFIVQPRLVKSRKPVASETDEAASNAVSRQKPLVFAFQFLIGLYGGYFGAGIGILMLSSLSLLIPGNIHQVNGLKTVLAGLINAASVVVFIGEGRVNWQLAVPMVASACLGGWLGATWARQLDKTVVRRIVIAIGIALSIWYFGREFSSLFSRA